jgi:hypothetical protein
MRGGKIVTSEEKELHFDDVLRDALAFWSNKNQVLKHHEEYSKALWLHDSTVLEHVQQTTSLMFVHQEGTDPKLWSKPLVGVIGYQQERGAKLRAIANPFRHFQMVLSPLAKALDDLLQELPWSCVHDQDAGIKFCLEGLAEGKTVSSIDLSSATDTFPLKVQLEVVRSIINRSKVQNLRRGGKRGLTQPEYQNPKGQCDLDMLHDGQKPADLLEELNIFEELARGQWYDREGKGEIPFLTWGKGQPLGMVPSFAMFTIAHGILIRNIEMKLGKSNTFRVLGDDVVITNLEVARYYVEELDYMGCEISALKTITSSQIAEFAGKIITANGVVPVEKWKPFSKANPLGPCECLGIKGLKFVPKTFRKRVAMLAAAPEPVGLGLNPKGLDWDSRVPPKISHWWWSTKRSIPTNEELSYKDAEKHQCGFWESIKVKTINFIYSMEEWLIPQKDYIPYPHDSVGTGYSRQFVDHVKAVNKSRSYPGDMEIIIHTRPSPNRGRFSKKLDAGGQVGRLYTYIRECKKAIKMNKDL